MSALERVLVWDYERGTLAYDLVCFWILVFLACVPQVWLGDPMAVRP